MIRSSTGLDNDVADRSPLVTVSNLSLSSPVSTIAAVGFHQSGSADALPMDATENVTTQPITMPSRGRGTHRRTALDVATDVEAAILAPVSGIVVRADSYTLYCCYPDSLVVIMPDVDPELEVRILHLGQLSVLGRRPGRGRRPDRRSCHILPVPVANR